MRRFSKIEGRPSILEKWTAELFVIRMIFYNHQSPVRWFSKIEGRPIRRSSEIEGRPSFLEKWTAELFLIGMIFCNHQSPVGCFSKIEGRPSILEKLRRPAKMNLSRPQKVKMMLLKKSIVPNPYWYELFAKKRIKIGQIWPRQLHFWSTPAYRGSPPCAIFPYPDNKEI